jgi:hypothetical protein
VDADCDVADVADNEFEDVADDGDGLLESEPSLDATFGSLCSPSERCAPLFAAQASSDGEHYPRVERKEDLMSPR